MRRQSEVSHADFLSAWESAGSLREVVELTGLSRCQVSGRAFRLRTEGVPMTPMQGRGGLRARGHVPSSQLEIESTGVDPEELRELCETFCQWRASR